MGVPVVIQRLFSYVPKKTLVIAGADLVRKLNVGNNWSRIRLGALVAVTPDGVNNLLSCPLYFGLCSGTTSPVGAYNTANFVGVSFIGAVNATTKLLTYAAGTGGNNYYTASTGSAFHKADGNVLSTVNFGSAANLIPAYTGAQRRRFPIIIDIARVGRQTGGAYTVSGWCPSTTAAVIGTDYRPYDLLGPAGIDSAGTPTPAGQTMTLFANALALNAGEEFGSFNTFNLYWGKSAFPLEVYAIGAVVLNSGAYNDAYGGADESVGLYSTGTLTTGTLGNALYGWSGSNAVFGYPNPGPTIGLAGTCGWPDDTFESYGTGTITSGVTISSGTGWSGAAVVI